MLLVTALKFALDLGVGYLPEKYNSETKTTDAFVEHPITGYVGMWVITGPVHIGWEHQSGLVGGRDPNGGVDSLVIKYRVESTDE
jgi:hypothetical protein